MAAARRFVTDIDPTCSAFARTVLLETWRALLPDTLPLARPLSLADRLRLVRAEVLDLAARSARAASYTDHQSIIQPLVTLAVAGGQKVVEALRYQPP